MTKNISKLMVLLAMSLNLLNAQSATDEKKAVKAPNTPVAVIKLIFSSINCLRVMSLFKVNFN